jgi:hypothetical protein
MITSGSPIWKTVSHKVRTYKEYHSVCPSSELGLPPTPHPQASVPPPPCFWGRGKLAGEKGMGESPFRRGAYTVVLFICTYFVVYPPPLLRGRTDSPGGEGDGGSIFWKTREIGLPSYNDLSTLLPLPLHPLTATLMLLYMSHSRTNSFY